MRRTINNYCTVQKKGLRCPTVSNKFLQHRSKNEQTDFNIGLTLLCKDKNITKRFDSATSIC